MFAEAVKNDRHAKVISFEQVYKFLGYDQYSHAVRQLEKVVPNIQLSDKNLSPKGEVSSSTRGPSKDQYIISVREFDQMLCEAKTPEGALARTMMLDVKDAVQELHQVGDGGGIEDGHGGEEAGAAAAR